MSQRECPYGNGIQAVRAPQEPLRSNDIFQRKSGLDLQSSCETQFHVCLPHPAPVLFLFCFLIKSSEIIRPRRLGSYETTAIPCSVLSFCERAAHNLRTNQSR